MCEGIISLLSSFCLTLIIINVIQTRNHRKDKVKHATELIDGINIMQKAKEVFEKGEKYQVASFVSTSLLSVMVLQARKEEISMKQIKKVLGECEVMRAKYPKVNSLNDLIEQVNKEKKNGY